MPVVEIVFLKTGEVLKMGLNFRVGDERCEAQWSYGGFHNFRKLLAEDIGVVLEEMEGFYTRAKDGYTPLVIGTKKWSDVRDPLSHLLRHSDCEGSISPSVCEKIAPRLREVCSKWNDDWIPGVSNHDKDNGLLLADAMERAAKINKPLRFT